MAAHGHYGNTRGVRYDPETQAFSLRCDDCVRYGRGTCYWPLTLEFWAPKTSMQRCRACNVEKKRRDMREAARAASPEERERKRISRLRYYHGPNNPTLRAKHAAYMRKRRERMKEKAA